MVSSPSSTAAVAHKSRWESKKENDLYKSIIQSELSLAVMLTAYLYSSILKGACWQLHLIKGCGFLTFRVKKDCHWVTQTFFFLFSRSVEGKNIGIQICDCYCEQMSPLASKGNGTSRPTLAPGAKQHTTTGLQRGQRQEGQLQQVNISQACSPQSFSLPCNYHQRTSVCCSSGTLPSQVS